MKSSLFKAFIPPADTVSWHEKALSALAALGGIGLMMAISQYFLQPVHLSLVVASMGASAVLLFALPAGPLSQPWPLVGGHLISAFVGVSCAHWIPDVVLASALAVAGSLLAMSLSRSLHPPGGATALSAVVTSATGLGYQFLLTPVLLNVMVLLVYALLVNNLLPHRCYPAALKHRQPAEPKTTTPEPNAILLNRVLQTLDSYVDVSPEQLQDIIEQVARQQQQPLCELQCHHIMTQPVIYAQYDTEVETLWQLMAQHKIRCLPIVDPRTAVIGIVTIANFLNRVQADTTPALSQRLQHFIRRTPGLTTTKPEYAGHLMTAPAITVRDNCPVLELFPLFHQHNVHHLPVVNEARQLVGIITPQNILEVLHRFFTCVKAG